MRVKFNFNRISTKILGVNLLILAVLIFIVVVSGVNFYQSRVSLNRTSLVYVPQISLANAIKETVLQQQVIVQSYINHPSLEVKNSYRELDRKFEANAKEIRQLATSSEDLDLIDRVKQEHDSFTMIANNVFVHSDKNQMQLVKTLLDNYSISVARVVASSDELAGRYAEELNKSIYSTGRNMQFALVLMICLTILSFAGALIITVVITKRLNSSLSDIVMVSQDIAQGDLRQRVSLLDKSELGQMATSFNSMVENLSSLIKEVVTASRYIINVSEDFRKHANDSTLASNTADSVLRAVVDSSAHQSRNITSICNSVDHVAEAIHHIDGTIQKLNKHNFQTTELAEDGKSSVEYGFRQMEIIKQTMGYVKGSVGELTAHMGEISRIVDVMEKFTEQTNMLALNAAIEAARVGKQGKGFAVVANEVRNLADESTKSLEQIRAAIQSIDTKSQEAERVTLESVQVVETGAAAMKDVTLSLHQIISFLHESVSQVHGLAGVTSSISEHSKLIVEDIKELESVSKETVVHSTTLAMVINRQTKAVMEAAASLAEIAVALEQSTGKFALTEHKKGERL